MNSLNYRYGVLSRQDTQDWRSSDGPILFESIGRQLSLSGALEIAKRLAKSETQICRLLYVDHNGMRMDGAEQVIERAKETLKTAWNLILQSDITPAYAGLLENLRQSLKELEALDV